VAGKCKFIENEIYSFHINNFKKSYGANGSFYDYTSYYCFDQNHVEDSAKIRIKSLGEIVLGGTIPLKFNEAHFIQSSQKFWAQTAL
jgi:hypothetical protein